MEINNLDVVPPPTFYLGQLITVDHVLKRRTKYSTNEYGNSKRLKNWEKLPLEKSKTAVVIGIRNLSNGYTSYDNEIGYMYNPTEYFKALLVVSALSKSPYFVNIP